MFYSTSKCLIAAVALALFTGAIAHGGNPAEFENGNQLYDAGKFAEAKKAYESLVNAAHFSANLFYNLGNAEYRLGNRERAALDYERALALDPAHSEARANLMLVRRETGAKIELERWFDPLFPALGENTFILLATIFAWAAVFAFALAFLMRARAARFSLGAVSFLFLAAYFGAGAFWEEQKNAASLVMEKSTDARLAPAETVPSIAVLPAGSRVRVLSVRGPWSYCVLPDEQHGWISSKTLQSIRPQS